MGVPPSGRGGGGGGTHGLFSRLLLFFTKQFSLNEEKRKRKTQVKLLNPLMQLFAK